MASLALLGAIEGGAKAFGATIQEEMQHQKTVALEKLRAKHNREAAEADHAMNMERDTTKHGMSLEALRAEEESKKGLATHKAELDDAALTNEEKNAAMWEEAGIDKAQQYEDQNLSARTREAGGVQLGKYLQQLGADPDLVLGHLLGEDTPAQKASELAVEFQKADPMATPEEIESRVKRVMDMAESYRSGDSSQAADLRPPPRDPNQREVGMVYQAANGKKVKWDGTGWLLAE